MTVQSRWTLPLIIDPPERLCVLVEVPNERYHIAAFLGALYELTRWYSWELDSAHTGQLVGAVWQPIFDSLRLQMCADFDCPITIEEWVEEMSLCDNIRFNADGKLQVLCCGQWVNVDGQPGQGIGGPGQPGGGSPLPPANGGCQSYHAVLSGNDQWLAPPVVNAGDTVTVSNLQGAWNDGAVIWFCPTGKEFFAGLCTTTTVLDALDPIPTESHMALLTKIAGSYHNISDGVAFTVPGGVSNALLIFQANDHSLGDNAGSITFDVSVCNNQVTQFTHHFNLRLSPYIFVLDPEGGATNAAWVAGSGFQASVTNPVVGGDGIIGAINNNLSPLAHCTIRAIGTCSSGATNFSNIFEQITGYPPTNPGEQHTFHAGSSFDVSFPFVVTPLHRFGVFVVPDGIVGTTVSLTDIYVTADGIDPF